MNDIKHIEEVLKILREFEPSTAYTGELGDIKQKSYVEYGTIALKIGEFEKAKRLYYLEKITK